MSHMDRGKSQCARQSQDSQPYRLSWWVIVVPFLVTLAVFVYQAFTPDRLSRYQTHLPFMVTDASVTPPRILELMVSYPDTLALEEVPKMGRPIQVWLTDSLADDPPRTYTVILEPLADGLMFTDEDGIPLAPSAQLSATKVPLETAVWFLHRTPGTALQPASVTLTPRVLSSNGGELEIKSASRSGGDAISIKLESHCRAFWRHFLDVVFGPATPLLTLAITLVSWFSSQRQREWEEKKKEKEQKEKRQREMRTRRWLSALASLQSLWETDHTAAIRRYFEIREEIEAELEEAELEEAEPELEAQRVIDRMWEDKWQTRASTEALDSLVRGDYQWTWQLRKALCGEGTESEDNFCCVLALVPSPSPSAVEQVRALIALAATRGKLLPESHVSRLAQTFAEALSSSEALREALDMLAKEYPAARWLMGTPEVRRHCQEWSREHPQDRHAKSLLNLAFDRIRWPRPWPLPLKTTRPDRGIQVALERLGWSENPFGPERIEDDMRAFENTTAILSGPWVKPPAWPDLAAAAPLWLRTLASGYGQTTALALVLQEHAERWRTLQDDNGAGRDLLFPVWLETTVVLRARTREEFLGEIAFGIGQALLHFLALNPLTFDMSSPTGQRAIARLCLACENRLGDLQSYLSRYLTEQGDAGSLTPRWLSELLRNVATGAEPLRFGPPAEMLFVLKDAQLARARGFVVALDIPEQLLDRAERTMLAQRLQPLIELLPELADSGVYLKVGLPAGLAATTGGMSEIRTTDLGSWTKEKLIELLNERLRRVSGGLGALMGPDVADDPSEWIVENALGSPRRLVRLGNYLLICLGSSGPDHLLTSKDLEEVCQQVERKSPAGS